MYRLQGWFPQITNSGFSIILSKEWKNAVSNSKINQEKIDKLIDNIGNDILQGHGINNVEKHLIKYYINVKWGEYGPEHINVPGNACGLDIDIDKSCANCNLNEISLVPHNVDSLNQASMILTIFVKIAEILESEIWLREHK